ncbi:hypothetical protein B0H19DRAFT_567754 [Mycena capillaripes]|nr:hypothetical protein B0H19DRAFT_567754 [Mycena capillaripes]
MTALLWWTSSYRATFSIPRPSSWPVCDAILVLSREWTPQAMRFINASPKIWVCVAAHLLPTISLVVTPTVHTEPRSRTVAEFDKRVLYTVPRDVGCAIRIFSVGGINLDPMCCEQTASLVYVRPPCADEDVLCLLL